jgi:hypothetical protein
VHGLVEGKETLNGVHPEVLEDALFVTRISMEGVPLREGSI